MLVFLVVSVASARISRVPPRCTTRLAPRLCAVHRHVHVVNALRGRMGQHRLRYNWVAERHPARRDRVLTYWLGVHRRTQRRYHTWRTYQQSESPIAVIDRIFGSAAPAAIAVARCESGLDPLAHNPSGAAGLFQLMPVHWQSQGYDPYDAATNTRIAYHLYESSGWAPWVCQP